MSNILLRDFVRIEAGKAWENKITEPLTSTPVAMLKKEEICKYDLLLDGIRDILAAAEKIISDTYDFLAMTPPKSEKFTGNESGDNFGPKTLVGGEPVEMHAPKSNNQVNRSFDGYAVDSDVEADDIQDEEICEILQGYIKFRTTSHESPDDIEPNSEDTDEKLQERNAKDVSDICPAEVKVNDALLLKKNQSTNNLQESENSGYQSGKDLKITYMQNDTDGITDVMPPNKTEESPDATTNSEKECLTGVRADMGFRKSVIQEDVKKPDHVTKESSSESGTEYTVSNTATDGGKSDIYNEEKPLLMTHLDLFDSDEDSGEEYDIEDWEIDAIIAEANRKEALEAGIFFIIDSLKLKIIRTSSKYTRY